MAQELTPEELEILFRQGPSLGLPPTAISESPVVQPQVDSSTAMIQVPDQSATPIDPNFAELLAQRRKELEAPPPQAPQPSKMALFLSSLGSSLKGQDAGPELESLQRIPLERFKMQQDAANKRKDQNLELARMGEQNKEYQIQLKSLQEDNDPASSGSAASRSVLAKLMKTTPDDPKIAKLSAAQAMKILGPLEKFAAIEASIASKLADKEFRREKAKGEKTNKLYQRTQGGVLGDLNKLRVIANSAKTNISNFSKDPSGYSDFGTLMQSLKSLQGDSSVVREAEITLGKNATSLINAAKNAIQQRIDGTALQPEQREQIIKVMSALAAGYDEAYKKAAKPTVVTAQKEGIPLDEIFDDPSMFAEGDGNVEGAETLTTTSGFKFKR